jgi:hypothetical protein
MFGSDPMNCGADGALDWAARPEASGGFDPGGRPCQRSGRETIVCEQSAGEWLAAHTDFSPWQRLG